MTQLLTGLGLSSCAASQSGEQTCSQAKSRSLFGVRVTCQPVVYLMGNNMGIYGSHFVVG